jgi:exodeoxyribonuclease-3
MQVVTLNLNGIRSAARKGFFAWAAALNADFICVQEVRAHLEKNCDESFHLPGYNCYFADAARKGYSGVGIYAKHNPQNIVRGLGWETADAEGRYIQLDFAKFSIASLYMPSGRSGDIRQTLKYEFMDRYFSILQKIARAKHDFIICGDWNIAHKQIDLKNWRANQKHSGFLPEERAWLDRVFGEEGGMVDAFRVINQEPDQYTWWSNFGRAWDRNVGWRIDYQVITKSLASKVRSATIYKKQRFSDHSPLIMEYDYKCK